MFGILKKKSLQDKIIIRQDNISFTPKQILKDIRKINLNLNHVKKPIIFLKVRNNFSFVIIYIALMHNDSVIFLIDENINQKKLKSLINKFDPNYLISLDKEDNYKIRARKIYQFNDYRIFLINKKKHKVNKDLKLLISTSGISGPSKFVMLSKENLRLNLYQICKYLKISSNDNVILNMPLSYSFGLSVLNSHFSKGSEITLSNNSIVEKFFWDDFNRRNITTLYAVPQVLEVLKKLKIDIKIFKHLRFMAVAGGKTNNEVLKYFLNISKKMKFNFFNMYGQTEASPRISYLNLTKNQELIGSIGNAVHGGKLYIKDKHNKIIHKPNIQGNLFYEGKNVMIGYATNKKDLTKKRTNKYKLDTKDIAIKDNKSNFYIVGRADKFVKINSIKIDLQDLEDYLYKFLGTNVCLEFKNKIYVCIEKKILHKIKIIKKLCTYSQLNKNNLKIFCLKKFPKNNNKISIFKIREILKKKLN